MTSHRNLFHQFVKEMHGEIQTIKKQDERTQEQMLIDLFRLETRFKKLLLSSPHGKLVYKQFMDYILIERGNILTTRVYFRERQNTFSTKISEAFRRKNSRALHRYRINFRFISWAMQRYKGPHAKPLNSILKKIAALRHRICVANLPLSINRARKFGFRSQESHLDYMDLNQACASGLIDAIDKFVPPYRTVFRSVSIGRMIFNMITDSNSTLLKFSPRERRILYRANNAVNKKKIADFDGVVDYVRESFGGVTDKTLTGLVAASSAAVPIDDKRDNVFTLSEKLPDTNTVEDIIIGHDLSQKLRFYLPELQYLEAKAIRLKYSI